MIAINQLLGTPFLAGGRSSVGIDCLGVTLAVSAHLGNPIPDPWLAFLEQWNRQAKGQPPLDLPGFPNTWRRLDYADDVRAWSRDVHTGDVWLWHGTPARMPGAGIMYKGRVWTAKPDAGVLALEPHRAPKPDEVWRP